VVDAPDDFTFHNLRGDVIRGLFDPNDDAPYFGPPSFSQPVLSPRGTKLSWVEGPDWSPEQSRLVGVSKLVVADSETGTESVRVKVGRNGEELHHADYDGRYWVGTFSKRMDRAPQPGELRVRWVATRAANPRVVEIGCSTGFIASIDRFVAGDQAGDAVSAGPACPRLPRGLALTGNGRHRVFRVTRSGSSALATVPVGVVTKAVRGRDGTVWAEARDFRRPNSTLRRILRFDPAGNRRVSESGDVRLSHVGTIQGRRTVVTYIDRDDFDPEQEVRGHVFVEHSSGARRSLTHASGIENSSSSAAPAVRRTRSGRRGSVIVLGRFEDLAERFAFHRPNGSTVRGLFDPNRVAPYGQPPLHYAPILSPHGAKLSWAEGPDWSQEQNRLVGVWKLVVANSKTGTESVRVKVGRNAEWLHHADYDGRYWVGTFSTSMAPTASELRVRVVDTWAANPAPVDAGCSRGFIASIDRFVKG
jgi:hypothetical protein